MQLANNTDESSKGYCVFEYLYRDASNYKAWGELLLSGTPSHLDEAALKTCLESEVFFVAEQVSIPSLYEELWALSGGRTEDDHALHEFVALRAASTVESEELPLFGNLSSVLRKFKAVSKWDYSLSPNFDSFWN